MWVVTVLASLVLLIVIALCVPLNFVFQVEVHGNLKLSMRLDWLFGLIGKEIPTTRPGRNLQKHPGNRIGLRTLFRILQIKGLFSQLKDWLKATFGCLKLQDLRGDFTIGLDDPADTGFLFAVISPIMPFLRGSRFSEIRVRPSFEDEAVCEGYLRGTVRLIPIQLVPPFLKFMFSLPTLRAIKTLVSGRSK